MFRKLFIYIVILILLGTSVFLGITMHFTKENTMIVDNVKRQYRLHLPKNFDKTKKYSLVIFLHGSQDNARLAEMYSGFSRLADKQDFVVVYPYGIHEKDFSPRAWNAEFCCGYAQEANINPETIVIDVPTVPSVPYHHSDLLEPMEIPVFQKTREGEKIPLRLSDISSMFDVLKGFINILRVYTEEKYVNKVSKAATKVIGGTPSSAKISF